MEEITLEKIDIIRQRFGISYLEAKEALEKNNGNLVDTLVYMEKNEKNIGEVISGKGNDLLETVKGIIEKGNVNRIKIKKGDKTLVDIPVNAGAVVGALSIYYTPILAIGAVAAIVSNISIEIERPDGRVEVLNNVIKDKSETVMEKIGLFAKKAKIKAESAKEKTENFIRNTKDEISNNEDSMIEVKNFKSKCDSQNSTQNENTIKLNKEDIVDNNLK